MLLGYQGNPIPPGTGEGGMLTEKDFMSCLSIGIGAKNTPQLALVRFQEPFCLLSLHI